MKTTIFSHAVNAIKANPQPSINAYQEPNQKNQEPTDNENQPSQSILQRIQLNPKHAKAPKSISLRKDGTNDFDSSRIQKKVIQKDLRKVLSRSSDNQNDWKHDNEFNTDNTAGGRFTVTLRNLSNSVTEETLKDVICDDRSILEFNLQTGKGEIIFSNKESARRAAGLLNDRILKGSKIRAQYIASISLSSSTANQEASRIQIYESSRNVELPNYHKDDYPYKKSEDSQEEDDLLEDYEEEEQPKEEERPSIFSRIKKSNK